MKTIIHPITGLPVKLGRNRPIVLPRSLHLGNYLTRKYTPPPSSVNWAPAAMPALHQIYLNNKLGCCVPSWGGHMEGVLTGNATGTPIIYTDQQIIDVYSIVGGYNGTPESDNGCDEITFLNYIQKEGFAGGTKVTAWMSVDATDPIEVRAGIDLFGTVMLTGEIPDAWINVGPNSFLWDVAGPPVQSNGHCFGSASYVTGRIGNSTWGMYADPMVGNYGITDAALAKYCVPSAGGGCYIVLSNDWINKASQQSPPGFNFSQLMTDFQTFH
jgi:hypothetical protein